MKKPKGIFIYLHHEDVIGKLSDAQGGRLLKALLARGNGADMPDLSDDPLLDVVATMLAKEVIQNIEHYNEVCENRRGAAKARESEKAAARVNAVKPKRGGFSTEVTSHEYESMQKSWDSMNPEINGLCD